MRPALWVALVVAALGAAVGVYLTSDKPDGLERVSQDLGLGAERDAGQGDGAGSAASAPAPRSRARRSVLALLGALAVAGVGFCAGRLLARGGRRRPGSGDAP